MAGIYYISLGCDKNRIDAEIMARRLLDAGHTIERDLDKSACAIVNTCGFIDAAKEQAIENIFNMVRAKQAGLIGAVIVTGCLAQRYAEELRGEIPEIDAAIGIGHNMEICDIVDRVLAGETIERFGPPERLVINDQRALSTPPHYAYLKIAEGCSNHCTFCAIPGIRGHYRSRPEKEILLEASQLVAQGVRELILIAQDTTSYGLDNDGGATLATLLKQLCDLPFWKIRILYAYPEKITDELIGVMAGNPRIARYLDIPMQHASPAVLRRMGRHGSGDELAALVGRLRKAMPDITLRSTFIAGFPGETEEQFEELLAFLGLAQLDRAGCFAFSPEGGTAAARLDGQLDDAIRMQRADRFMQIQTEILLRKQDLMLGAEIQVLCDGYDEERGHFICRGESDAPEIDTAVLLPLSGDLMPGELYRVRITGVDGADLVAERIK